jgi:type I restriction enzyme S subunit
VVSYSGKDFWPLNTALYVVDFHGNAERFAYYFLKQIDFKRYNSGSAQPSLNRNFIHPILVTVPCVREQRAIAHILGTLDDKIELNRRMNQTLEEMVRALFTSWFVDFDPVRAKAEGREPVGMDGETASLFPDGFEDSELGPIPEGWRVEGLDSIANFRNGLALQRYRPEDGEDGLPIVKIAQLRAGKPNYDERATSSIDPDCILEDGDVVFSWSGTLMVVLWSGGQAALNQHLFRVTSRDYPRWFYLSWLWEHLPEFQRIAADKATTMGHIQRRHLTEAKCVAPQPDLIDRATTVLEPLIEAQLSNDIQSRNLTDIRDSLLPKLLSGELRIDDPERFLEEAALT